MSALQTTASPVDCPDGSETELSPELTEEMRRQRAAKARSLANLRPWQKGQPSANPSGRKPVPESVVKLAQAATEECMQRLLHLSRHAEKENVQLAATLAILERAWGRAPLTVQLSGATEDASKFADALRDAAAAARIALARGQRMDPAPAAPSADISDAQASAPAPRPGDISPAPSSPAAMSAGDMSSRPSSPGVMLEAHGSSPEILPPLARAPTQYAAPDQGAAFAAGLAVGLAALQAEADDDDGLAQDID